MKTPDFSYYVSQFFNSYFSGQKNVSKNTVISYATTFKLAQPSGNTQEGFRDMVLLSVLYDTGARVQELVDIRIKHIRLEKPAVVMLHGKGNKSRHVPIMPSTVNLLRSYLAS